MQTFLRLVQQGKHTFQKASFCEVNCTVGAPPLCLTRGSMRSGHAPELPCLVRQGEVPHKLSEKSPDCNTREKYVAQPVKHLERVETGMNRLYPMKHLGAIVWGDPRDPLGGDERLCGDEQLRGDWKT